MSKIEIDKVNPKEIDTVMALVRDAVRQMEKNDIYQWDEVYPDKTVLAADIAAGQLFCVKSDSVIVGIMSLNEDQFLAYTQMSWRDPGRPLVMHRLCIKPAFQGQSLAKPLVMFAEEFARKNNYSSIRLDAFTNTPKALGLYDTLRYQRRGIFKSRKGDFYCFEKVL